MQLLELKRITESARKQESPGNTYRPLVFWHMLETVLRHATANGASPSAATSVQRVGCW